MTSRLTERRKQRAQRREGIVLLVVMLMLLMASGTALFALQATSYEQRASTSFGEAAWARSLSECSAMAGLAVIENGGILGNPRLGSGWTDVGGVPSSLSRKFGFPSPLNQPGVTPPLGADVAASTDSAGAQGVSATLPVGVAGMIGPARDAQPNYWAPAPSVGPNPGQHFINSHQLHETFTFGTPPTATTPGVQLVRTVVTGFGEIAVRGDQLDTGNVRGIHEIVAISRAYFDSF